MRPRVGNEAARRVEKMPLIPVWDAMAFAIWLVSFGRKTIRWRGVDYSLQDGKFVNATPAAPQTTPSQS